MATGGLSRTDVGKREVIGGDALEFYWLVGRHYEMNRFDQQVAWFYEPGVAERVLRDWLSRVGVDVLLDKRLREKGGVAKQDLRIASVTMQDGSVYQARVFADSSYEGDLMAQAGVSYTWGRESRSQYGESLAGVPANTPRSINSQFRSALWTTTASSCRKFSPPHTPLPAPPIKKYKATTSA